MSRLRKLQDAIKRCSGTFPYRDVEALMALLGYELQKGSGGSARCFAHPVTQDIIRFHEPHPKPEMKAYAVRQLRDHLKDRGLL